MIFPIFQLEPVGNKTFTQDFEAGVDLKCPSEVTSSHNVSEINITCCGFVYSYVFGCFSIRPTHSFELLSTATTLSQALHPPLLLLQ